jgi:hypothetical protein
MKIYDSLLEMYLKDLQSGIRMPIKLANGNWSEKWAQYQDILKGYCTLTVPRKVFLSKYNSLPPIETLANEEKIEWRKFVNDAFPGTTPQFRLEAVKICYCIGVLTS